MLSSVRAPGTVEERDEFLPCCILTEKSGTGSLELTVILQAHYRLMDLQACRDYQNVVSELR